MLKFLLLWTFIIVLIILFSEFVKFIMARFLFSEKTIDDLIHIVSINKKSDSIEYLLRSKIFKVKWLQKHSEIICLDCGMDKNTRKICEIFSRKHDFISLYSIK
ncbi:MAG: hypothetical protein RsTaC01_0067 [Candidatus Paraimprobicoccus trichonymphae]|uniref:Uncharacterized protein n=1 Tax=Candidatus Paraimprobicoccus trichonymphae TaxID=3033793 RepID=A0AA48KZK2_9FIRM|nr:MAG: hypothetical protein RsTaC01_0067 [Candidatus Paraimprobicoccus trichonymphae]